LRRELYYLRGLGRPPHALARLPWPAAENDPADTETVAEFGGAFEPKRRGVFYGAPEPPARIPHHLRDSILRVRRFHNVILLPHHVILSQEDGRVLPVSFDLLRQKFWLEPGSANARAPQFYNFEGDIHAPRTIDEPVFLADSVHEAYGHSLMEATPMLQMAGAVDPQQTVVTSARIYRPFFEGLGIEMSRVLKFHGPLYCRSVLIPDPPLDLTGNLHSVARQAFARLGALAEQASVQPRKRIYLSRSLIGARRLRNEGQVEALFRRYGFEIVHLQNLPIPDQIALIRNAEMVAGPAGSAMHNLLFAPRETKALILWPDHWFVDLDLFVAKADDQFGFVMGRALPLARGQSQHDRHWRVDIAMVEAALKRHFGL
jgi:hypothetical protein